MSSRKGRPINAGGSSGTSPCDILFPRTKSNRRNQIRRLKIPASQLATDSKLLSTQEFFPGNGPVVDPASIYVPVDVAMLSFGWAWFRGTITKKLQKSWLAYTIGRLFVRGPSKIRQ